MQLLRKCIYYFPLRALYVKECTHISKYNLGFRITCHLDGDFKRFDAISRSYNK